MEIKGETNVKKRITLMLIVLLVSVVAVFAQATTEERVGIISAMDNEIKLLLENAEIDYIDSFGGIDFNVGTLCGKDVIIVKAGIGKVLAASCAATLLCRYNITDVIFTGIAGGVGDQTNVLDVVIGDNLVQHDYGQVSLDGFVWEPASGGDEQGIFTCDPELVRKAYDASVSVVGSDHAFQGTIATGDQFIASDWYVKELQERFNALACEMEGCAVAAVCTQYDVPFVVIRTMSDKADGLAHESMSNMGDIAADNSSKIVMELLKAL